MQDNDAGGMVSWRLDGSTGRKRGNRFAMTIMLEQEGSPVSMLSEWNGSGARAG